MSQSKIILTTEERIVLHPGSVIIIDTTTTFAFSSVNPDGSIAVHRCHGLVTATLGGPAQASPAQPPLARTPVTVAHKPVRRVTEADRVTMRADLVAALQVLRSWCTYGEIASMLGVAYVSTYDNREKRLSYARHYNELRTMVEDGGVLMHNKRYALPDRATQETTTDD